ncbi:MAG: aminotransferase class I/II-fold pyridoxal phosphate-dependent enzyme [Clostridia bacterium]|nr:aminotransferase class I/II-fold pyridoxal phosphate-dependent enzyme [Clostridia bacterium]
MREYASMNKDELLKELELVRKEYDEFKARGLSLDMSRGKPGADQLNLSNGLFHTLTHDDYCDDMGIDCRNYGGIDGIKEAKEMFAELLEIEPDEVIIGGNSSLALMFDNIASNMTHGVHDGQPWATQGGVKFLCPSPGYDRHFSICKYMHITMIPIKMTPDGPDMDEVERLAQTDPMIKGIWCVPKYSNPDGIVYSDETVRRIAYLKPAASDFRVYWDNAYFIHHIDGEIARIPNILRLCKEAGNEDMPLIFCSFSKVTFPGSAISCLAASKTNIEYIKKRFSIQMVGPDKLNQLRHVRFLKNAQGVIEHMNKHAAILKPKFDAVDTILRERLGGLGIINWKRPSGGYFISVFVKKGCAKRVVELCKNAGVKLTAAGATYPYGYDPDDSNIRIAPTYPGTDELKKACELFCICTKLAALEKLTKEFR